MKKPDTLMKCQEVAEEIGLSIQALEELRAEVYWNRMRVQRSLRRMVKIADYWTRRNGLSVFCSDDKMPVSRAG